MSKLLLLFLLLSCLLYNYNAVGIEIDGIINTIDKLSTKLEDRCNYVTSLETQLQTFTNYKVGISNGMLRLKVTVGRYLSLSPDTFFVI